MSCELKNQKTDICIERETKRMMDEMKNKQRKKNKKEVLYRGIDIIGG